MRHLFAFLVFGATTVAASAAAWTGVTYPAPLAQPVSVRQGSAPMRAGVIHYFSGSRRHTGGGYRGGK